MSSPLTAMVWENWRLTRNESLQRLGVGILGGSFALNAMDNATVAFWLLFALNALIFMSTAKLNGGRFLDGYKPGFPFFLLYARPVSTRSMVAVAMLYDTIAGIVLYLVTAASLELLYGQRFPMLSLIPILVLCHFAYICLQWASRSRTLQWVGSIVVFLPAFLFLQARAAVPMEITFSVTEQATMLLLSVLFFILTVAGVSRQRRGDAFSSAPRAASAGYPEWLIGFFRIRCPTSSPLAAQLWFELRSSGLPVLVIGLGTAILIPLLFGLGIPVEYLRPFAQGAVMFGALAVLLLTGGNAFGIRRKQGKSYGSAFELTRAHATPALVGIKLLTRWVCMLVALALIGASAWMSSAMISAWSPWMMGGKDATVGLLEFRQSIAETIGAQSGFFLAAQAVLASVAVGVVIALLAAVSALRVRYVRQVRIAVAVVLGWGFLLVLSAVAGKNGFLPSSVVPGLFIGTGWTLVIGIVLGSIYLIVSGFAERALSIKYLLALLPIPAAFAITWISMLSVGGVNFPDMSVGGLVGFLWPILLPLLAGALAPWSFSRVRHQ